MTLLYSYYTLSQIIIQGDSMITDNYVWLVCVAVSLYTTYLTFYLNYIDGRKIYLNELLQGSDLYFEPVREPQKVSNTVWD